MMFMKRIIFLFVFVLMSTFVVAEFDSLDEILDKAEGKVLPQPLSLIYKNERINILIQDTDTKISIEIKEGKVVEISDSIKNDYTLSILVKGEQTVTDIFDSDNPIKQFNKAKADKEIIISPRGLASKVKWFFIGFLLKFF